MRRVFVLIALLALFLTPLPLPAAASAAAVEGTSNPGTGAAAGDDFGTVAVGSSSSIKHIELFTGGVQFTGFAITGANSGEFTLVDNSCATKTPDATACSYTITFTPRARGSRTATLTVSCSDRYSCPKTIALSGTGGGTCGTMFGDVKGSDPACEAIEGLAARGIIKGCDQGAKPPLFCPKDPTLRAQMAALIARAVGWDAEDHNNTFPDRCKAANTCIDADLWRNVGTLQFYGVAKGFQDGTYNPFDNVLSAQTISFITRALVKKGTWTQATVDDGTVYPNVPASSGHRLDLVTYVKYAGAVPDTASATGAFTAWDKASTRAWFARARWQALNAR